MANKDEPEKKKGVKEEVFPPQGTDGWLEEPAQAKDNQNTTIDSKVAYSTEDDSGPPNKHMQLLHEFTTAELMEELHNRFDHILLLAKKPMQIPKAEAKDLRTGITSMFIGDVHVLLGMSVEVEDHLKQMLSDRRMYVSESSYDMDDFLNADDDEGDSWQKA